jgi:purine nucleosidase
MMVNKDNINILFDTDLIGDDILTLIMALGIPEVKLEGVTAFGRRYSALDRATVALKVLNYFGIQDVPVAAGANRPLMREPSPGCIGCDSPIMEFLGRNLEIKKQIKVDAIELIIDTIKKKPNLITILCTGPLTNLASAVLVEPMITNLVKNVVIMGGAAWVPGNRSPVAESNIFNDPEAAAIVFSRFPKITMVGLDVTMKTLIDTSILDKICPRRTTIEKLVYGITTSCIAIHKERDNLDKMPLHDPLALLVAVYPSLVKTEFCEVKIETGGIYTTGQTVCQPLKNKNGKQGVDVAIEVDSERAINLFARAISGAVSDFKGEDLNEF